MVAPQGGAPAKKGKLQTKFGEFCTDSSLSAITRAYTAKNRTKRYVWVILFLAAMTIISVQTYFVLSKYFSYPSETTIELKFQAGLEFPAVTVCNLNPVRMSAISNPRSPFFVFRKPPDPLKDPLFKRMAEQNSVSTTTKQTTSVTSSGSTEGSTASSTTTMKTTSSGLLTSTLAGTKATMEPKPGRRKRDLNDTTTASPITTASPSTIATNASPSTTASPTTTDFNRWSMLNDNSTAKQFYEKRNERYEMENAFAKKVADMGLSGLAQLGHQIDNFISDCSWTGFPCSPRNFTTIQNYKYGNCFTFNSGMLRGETIKSSNRAGSLYGLTLEIFIEQGEYVPQFSQEAGVRVVIHKPRTMPFPEDKGFNVPPGASTALGLKKVAITRLPAPHGECVMEPNTPTLYSKNYGTDYSKTACVKSCFQENVITSCDCAMPEYPIPTNVTVCDDSNTAQVKCRNNVTDYFKKKLLGCDDNCLLPCDDTEFEVMVSQSVWPSRAFEGQLRQKLELGSSLMKDKAGSAKSNMVKIEVYFREMTYQEIAQQESYQVANVLSDIGGTFGLWLGLSAISLCEFLEFVFSICNFVNRKREEREQKQAPVTDISTNKKAWME